MGSVSAAVRSFFWWRLPLGGGAARFFFAVFRQWVRYGTDTGDYTGIGGGGGDWVGRALYCCEGRCRNTCGNMYRPGLGADGGAGARKQNLGKRSGRGWLCTGYVNRLLDWVD